MVDREQELARLREAARESPHLVVMRGRRRVGKSFLLARAFDGPRTVYFQADEQDEAGHLAVLAAEAARLLPGVPPLRLDTWDSAFALMGDQATEEPIVLVLDEFQYLWDAQPALDSILQRHWDRWDRSRTPITVVLCGSAIGMMERLLDHGSPLFGRATYRPLLQPLDYRFAAEFASSSLSPEDRLRRYAVLGGVPQYQAWAGKGSLRSIIRDRILTTGEPLHEDPLHLLRGEPQIHAPGTYFSIIAAIAGGATRLSQISNRAHVEVPNLTKMLARLEELGYVEQRAPVEPRRSAPRASYRICDPFFRFWFRYVFPNRSRLARHQTQDVLGELTADLDTFMGLAFEDCCREWVGHYAPRDLVPACETLGAYWSRKGDVEIDVAGLTDRRYVLLGSCKWTRRARADTLAQLLDHQAHLGPAARRAKLAIFARGFDAELARRADDEDVLLVDAARLFA